MLYGVLALRNNDVISAYETGLKKVKETIADRKVFPCYQGGEINIKGLNGWIFENVVADSIKKEIPNVEIQYQPKLFPKGSRKKHRPDLLINGGIYVEVKVRGSFGEKTNKVLKNCKKHSSKTGFAYLYISIQEKYDRYYKETIKILGKNNAFFLDKDNDWQRFIARIRELMHTYIHASIMS